MIISYLHLRDLDPLNALRRQPEPDPMPLVERLTEWDRIGVAMRRNVIRNGVPGCGKPRVLPMGPRWKEDDNHEGLEG